MTAKNHNIIVSDDVGTVYCPGCQRPHKIDLTRWSWNLDAWGVTLTPSLVVEQKNPKGVVYSRCHSWIKDGNWNYLTDCTHPLAGQTIAMMDPHTRPS